ncbi:MAG: hypothetical protein EXQ77_05120 [Thermoleophilia bacterium]|nr:hypothetical protein [Thermoleophilia bacterium]
MSYRTCPDWPDLMEAAPTLQFKHMTVREAQLPVEVVAQIPAELALDTTEICCDADRRVVNGAHTHAAVVAALVGSTWFELAEWVGSGRPDA